MLLADLGAEVILVERPARPGDPLELGRNNICNRGKRSICLDLKNSAAVELVLEHQLAQERLSVAVYGWAHLDWAQKV